MTLVYVLVLSFILYAIKIDLSSSIKEVGTSIHSFVIENISNKNKSEITSKNEKDLTQSKDNGQVNNLILKEKVVLDAPVISQLPELERGCEVTSLAMLLQYGGVKVSKLQLAKEVEKDLSPLTWKNGQKYYGNPYRGFVGDIYSKSKPGLGVYHEPIERLAEKYLPEQIINLTSGDFNQVLSYLSKDVPVWVIINTEYKHLPEHYFETWYTAEGPVSVTYKEHSVLVTGYDQEYIYFNDPLTNMKNRKAPIADFEAAWVQMGRQAITIKSN